ncbi:MAG: DUF169 domain-containing protein [Planctomycetes bacterium]|nr:DUF169 domain-containing protein [Planctomycetota bacterium]
MNPDPTKLLEIAGIEIPLIGFYDVPDSKPFEPFAKPKRCFFSAYENWLKGESICISKGTTSCQGGGYWIGGIMPEWAVKSAGPDISPREAFAKGLNQREGFKSSDELMCQWFKNLKPHMIENGYVVIGPLKDEQYDFLKTVTFFVNPDQLSLLLLGTEYYNASVNVNPTITSFGSGCGQLAALFGNFDPDIPKAIIGATDIAMRENLPPDILALTVNKPMYKQLCELDENSFLYKPFWRRLRKVRGEAIKET